MLVKVFVFFYLIFVLQVAPAHAKPGLCQRLLELSKFNATVQSLKKKMISYTLEVMAAQKGLPKYLKINEELRRSSRYRLYPNFGEMGLAEMGLSVEYDQNKSCALNTGRPLIIVANHHLGIADGLALQYLAARSRDDSPSLIFLARWIEKLLPHAVFGDEHLWGTAIPVEINLPKNSDPDYEAKMAEVKTFNSSWTLKYLRVLKKGGALIIFPAGHVASINEGEKYPAGVYDSPDSWQDGFLNLARIANADIVFANVDSVNSEAFYNNRKRFGGGDKERVIWFFGEALAKRDQPIRLYLTEPMSLGATYLALSQRYGYSPNTLESDPHLTAELMRQFTYQFPRLAPQELSTREAPQIRQQE